MEGKLSRKISETLGVKQGNIKSSDNYKIYANPLLDALDSANLAVQLGPVNCGFSSCADDLHLMTDTQSKMQALLDISSHYAKMYKVSFGADKTKITVVGSKADMTYYSNVSPWMLDGVKVKVRLDNEHLGQIVSPQSLSENPPIQDIHLSYPPEWFVLFCSQTKYAGTSRHLSQENSEGNT